MGKLIKKLSGSYNLYNLYNLFVSLLVIKLIFPKRGKEVIDVMEFIFKSYNLEQNLPYFYIKNENSIFNLS